MLQNLRFLKYLSALLQAQPFGVCGDGLHWMLIRRRCMVIILLSIYLPEVSVQLKADEPTRMMISELYEQEVQPLLFKFCGECHGAMPVENDLDLTRFSTTDAILSQPNVLIHVAERLRAGDMPPNEARQPSQGERDQLLNWMTMALDVDGNADA